MSRALKGYNAVWILLAAYVLLGFAGSGLLKLPAATKPALAQNYYYTDAIFTAASAVTLTGLPYRDIGGDFTPLGQMIILGLIQVGGLITMIFGTMLAYQLSRRLLPRRAKDLLKAGEDDAPPLATIARYVVLTTFAIEAVGAVLLYPLFAADPGTKGNLAEAAWYSMFHSVSAFCNSGLSLYKQNLQYYVFDKENEMFELRAHWQVLGVMGPLIILGGLGLPVLQDAGRWLGGLAMRVAGKAPAGTPEAPGGLALHTKLVLATTLLMVVLGGAGFVLTESISTAMEENKKAFGADIGGEGQRNQNDWVALKRQGRMREGVFTAISARSGGFSTLNCSTLSNSSKLWLCGLMTVGASPAGTGGGMKTVTFALLALTVASVLRRRNEVGTFDRTLPGVLLKRAGALAGLYLAFVFLTTLAVALLSSPQTNFIDLLFECCSACGNCGLSTGLTAGLGDNAKTAIMAAMLVGRVGPLAMMLALTAKEPGGQDEVVLG